MVGQDIPRLVVAKVWVGGLRAIGNVTIGRGCIARESNGDLRRLQYAYYVSFEVIVITNQRDAP
jgi:hypothetical protein